MALQIEIVEQHVYLKIGRTWNAIDTCDIRTSFTHDIRESLECSDAGFTVSIFD